jgi:hypothetical protein
MPGDRTDAFLDRSPILVEAFDSTFTESPPASYGSIVGRLLIRVTTRSAVYINGRTIDVSSNFTTEPKFEAINSNNQFVGRFSTGPLGSDSYGLIGTPIATQA